MTKFLTCICAGYGILQAAAGKNEDVIANPAPGWDQSKTPQVFTNDDCWKEVDTNATGIDAGHGLQKTIFEKAKLDPVRVCFESAFTLTGGKIKAIGEGFDTAILDAVVAEAVLVKLPELFKPEENKVVAYADLRPKVMDFIVEGKRQEDIDKKPGRFTMAHNHPAWNNGKVVTEDAQDHGGKIKTALHGLAAKGTAGQTLQAMMNKFVGPNSPYEVYVICKEEAANGENDFEVKKGKVVGSCTANCTICHSAVDLAGFNEHLKDFGKNLTTLKAHVLDNADNKLKFSVDFVKDAYTTYKGKVNDDFKDRAHWIKAVKAGEDYAIPLDDIVTIAPGFEPSGHPDVTAAKLKVTQEQFDALKQAWDDPKGLKTTNELMTNVKSLMTKDLETLEDVKKTGKKKDLYLAGSSMEFRTYLTSLNSQRPDHMEELKTWKEPLLKAAGIKDKYPDGTAGNWGAAKEAILAEDWTAPDKLEEWQRLQALLDKKGSLEDDEVWKPFTAVGTVYGDSNYKLGGVAATGNEWKGAADILQRDATITEWTGTETGKLVAELKKLVTDTN